MKIRKLSSVYFSATYTTRKIVRLIVKELNISEVKEHDITQGAPSKDIPIESNELLIVGVPVYAGRIPQQAVAALKKFKGDSTPAIIVCVYGNRHYDDALIELKDIFEANNFKLISAGTFIATHSIFPEVAKNRPDETDQHIIKEFAKKSLALLEGIEDISTLPEIKVKGNHPYREAGKVPLHPKGNKKCDECGTCVRLCPVKAIDEKDPKKTDADKCISCARCIVVCPQHSRHFGKIIHSIASRKFVAANSVRKEPEVVYIPV